MKRIAALVVLSIVLCAHRAAHADRITTGYMISRPITRSGTGASHAVDARYDRTVWRALELGLGLEIGVSGGDEPIARFAILPGIAYTFAHVGELALRIEEQGGWQIVRGRLTIDGIPFRGIETQGWHNEIAIAADAALGDRVDLRARAGIVIDAIYPGSSTSLRAGPFIGISFVISTR
jgi:hypothetical protein